MSDPFTVPSSPIIGELKVIVLEGTIPASDGTVSPFVEIQFEGQTWQSSVKKNSTQPFWNEYVFMDVRSKTGEILANVWNYIDGAKPVLVGHTVIELERFSMLKHGVLDSDFPLQANGYVKGPTNLIPESPKSPGPIRVRPKSINASPISTKSQVASIGKLRMKLEWQTGARGRTSEMVYLTTPVKDSEDVHRSILSSNLFAPETSLATDPPQYDTLFKVIVVGDSGVGKSNIMSRWLTGKFSQNIVATVNIEFAAKSFDCEGKVVKIQLWDTAGQERYKAITRQYYRGAHGAVVVYDVTRRSSFEHIADWLLDLKEYTHNEHIQVLLIGNKIDMENDRTVETQEALDFAKEHKINFLETSALDGSNCSKSMQMILQDIYTVYLQIEASKPKKTPQKISMSKPISLNLDDLVDDKINTDEPQNGTPLAPGKRRENCQC